LTLTGGYAARFLGAYTSHGIGANATFIFGIADVGEKGLFGIGPRLRAEVVFNSIGQLWAMFSLGLVVRIDPWGH
jgi:hypothetical protein